MIRSFLFLALFNLCASYLHGNEAVLDSLRACEIKAQKMQKSDPSKAIQLYSQALSFAIELQNQEKQAEQYHKRGRVYSDIGLNGMAIRSYREARQLYSNLNMDAKTAWVILDIGNVYYKQEEKREVALEHYHKALDLFRTSEEHDGEVVALNNIGLTHLMFHQLDQAITGYKQAVAAELAYADTLRLIFTYSYLGDAYRFLDNAENGTEFQYHGPDSNLVLAHQFLKKGLELGQAFGDHQGLAQIYEYYGSLYSYQQQYDSALVYFQQSLQQYEQLENVKMQALQRELYAEQYYKMGSKSTAISENEKLLDFAQIHGLKSTELATTLRLAGYYAEMADYQRSAELYAAGNRLNELFQEELSAAQLEYEKEIQEQRLELLNRQMEMKVMELRHERSVNTNLIIGGVLLLIALIIILINLRQQLRTNKILVRKNLEIAEQQRNHPRFNGQKTDPIEVGDLYKNSSLTDDQKKELFNDIKVYLAAEKQYLSPDFKIEDVAKAVSTNRNYASQIINEQSGGNFSNFINEYRVEEAMQELINPDNANMTIEAIAQKVGFKSKSAFNNAFKKFCGITPSAFVSGKKEKEG